jgi:hypothetical protein
LAGLLFGIVDVVFFDGHIFELTGFEDFAALFTFDVFDVFFASYDLHTGVLTHCLRLDFLRGSIGGHRLVLTHTGNKSAQSRGTVRSGEFLGVF